MNEKRAYAHLPHFKIDLQAAGRGSVEMDGQKLEGVTKVIAEGAVNSFSKVTIQFIGTTEIEAEPGAIEFMLIPVPETAHE